MKNLRACARCNTCWWAVRCAAFLVAAEPVGAPALWRRLCDGGLGLRAAAGLLRQPHAGQRCARGLLLAQAWHCSGLLYVLLQLERTALVVGALALFAVLALVMVLTRQGELVRPDRPTELPQRRTAMAAPPFTRKTTWAQHLMAPRHRAANGPVPAEGAAPCAPAHRLLAALRANDHAAPALRPAGGAAGRLHPRQAPQHCAVHCAHWSGAWRCCQRRGAASGDTIERWRAPSHQRPTRPGCCSPRRHGITQGEPSLSFSIPETGKRYANPRKMNTLSTHPETWRRPKRSSRRIRLVVLPITVQNTPPSRTRALTVGSFSLTWLPVRTTGARSSSSTVRGWRKRRPRSLPQAAGLSETDICLSGGRRYLSPVEICRVDGIGAWTR